MPETAHDGAGGQDASPCWFPAQVVPVNDGQAVGAIPRIPIPQGIVWDHRGPVSASDVPPVVALGRPAEVVASPIEVDKSRPPSVEPTRNPCPTAHGAVIDPASVVVGEPTPGLMAHPGQPCRKIAPPSVSERSPSYRGVGHPDMPVTAGVSPVAMFVQRLDPGKVNASQVRGRTTADHGGVPLSAPLLEIVRIPSHRLDSDPACVQK